MRLRPLLTLGGLLLCAVAIVLQSGARAPIAHAYGQAVKLTNYSERAGCLGITAIDAGDDRLYFTSTVPPFNDQVLLESDGTIAGTKSVNFGTDVLTPTQPLKLGTKRLFFSGNGELRASTMPGSSTVISSGLRYDAGSVNTHFIGVVNNLALFALRNPAFGSDVWATNGVTMTKIFTINATSNPSDFSAAYPSPGTLFAGALYFTAFNPSQPAIFRSDGTAAGSYLVEAVGPRREPLPTGVAPLTAAGTKLYYMLNDTTRTDSAWAPAALTSGLWATDGTPGAAVYIANQTSKVEQLTAFGTKLAYFVTPSGTGNRELWTSDGTAAGTAKVAGPFLYTSDITLDLTTTASTIFFKAYLPSGSGQPGTARLWASDGTSVGTRQVVPYATDAPTRTLDFEPQYVTQVTSSTVVFLANNSALGRVPWQSDGTATGTFDVVSIPPWGTDQRGNSGKLTVVGNNVFFTAASGNCTTDLYTFPLTALGLRSDRTPTPTTVPTTMPTPTTVPTTIPTPTVRKVFVPLVTSAP